MKNRQPATCNNTKPYPTLNPNQGRQKQCEAAGQPFQKGTSFFWAAIFAKTLLYGYSITCGYYGSANFDINLNNFIRCTVLKAQNKTSKRTYVA
jgi:hypothetical protein